MHGNGMFCWTNGQIFKGCYQNDFKNGPGRLEFPDGTIVESTWVNGKLHGKGLISNKEGKSRQA